MSRRHRSGPEVAGLNAGAAPSLTAETVKHRALHGVLVLVTRGIAARAIGFVAGLVLARLLTPRDFGIVAFGMAVLTFGTFIADAGLGAGFIRREEAPSEVELGTLLGVQLAITLAVVAVTAAVAPLFGSPGLITVVMVASLPFVALRMPGVILIERALDYRRLAVVELLEVLVYFAAAVVGVLVGLGVWALAVAPLARSVFAAVMMLTLVRDSRVRPRVSLGPARQLLGFGAQFQAVGVVGLVRDQGLNVGVVAIAGTTTLGLWVLAFKILQAPLLVFESLWKISYPAMSRLVAAGEPVRPVIERSLRLGSIASGVLLSIMVTVVPPLVPLALGHQWEDATQVLPLAMLGLLVGGPVSVSAAGYLYAVGDAGGVLWAALLHSAAWLVGALVLLPRLGLVALGFGWFLAAAADAAILGRRVQRHSGARVFDQLLRPGVISIVAGATGYALSNRSGRPALDAAAVAACLVLLAGGMGLFQRVECRDLVALAWRSRTLI